jgi:hypothetical protein
MERLQASLEVQLPMLEVVEDTHIIHQVQQELAVLEVVVMALEAA